MASDQVRDGVLGPALSATTLSEILVVTLDQDFRVFDPSHVLIP